LVDGDLLKKQILRFAQDDKFRFVNLVFRDWDYGKNRKLEYGSD